MNGTMRVAEIWRFPVKSMAGETLLSAPIGELGIEGDRGWAVHDVDTGTTLTARRTPELLFASARIVDGEVVVTLPDGAMVGEGDDDALSAWLGRSVELRSAGEHNLDVGGTYEAPLDFENDADWTSWQGPGGAFHDSSKSRVSIVSLESLGAWDRRRFRTNVILEGAEASGAEDDLVGSRLRLGDALLTVEKRIDRCVMVTRPQPGLDRDLDLLRTINADHERCLAIGCLVAAPGDVAVGGAIQPVS